MTLNESGVDGVGKCETAHVLSKLVPFNFVSGPRRGSLQGLERVDFEEAGFIGNDRKELVVDDLNLCPENISLCYLQDLTKTLREKRANLVVIVPIGLDLVGNRQGIRESRDFPSNLIETQSHIVSS